MEKLKQKIKRLINSRHLGKGIFFASLFESTVVPIPIEAVLVPVMQARRDKIWTIALAATIGCLIGALIGYAFGYFLFELAQSWLVDNLTTEKELDSVIQQMQYQGFYVILSFGILPIPLQLAMIAAGATSFSLGLYILAVAISRIIRYYGIAIVIYYAGNHAEQLIRKYKYTATVGVLAVIFLIWYSSLS